MEVTTLLIPGENAGVEENQALAQWLASVRPDIPLHLFRFSPGIRCRTARPPR